MNIPKPVTFVVLNNQSFLPAALLVEATSVDQAINTAYARWEELIPGHRRHTSRGMPVLDARRFSAAALDDTEPKLHATSSYILTYFYNDGTPARNARFHFTSDQVALEAARGVCAPEVVVAMGSKLERVTVERHLRSGDTEMVGAVAVEGPK